MADRATTSNPSAPFTAKHVAEPGAVASSGRLRIKTTDEVLAATGQQVSPTVTMETWLSVLTYPGGQVANVSGL